MLSKAKVLNNRERAYQHLRHAILVGDIAYGHRLVDKDIAQELGMSRMPVREALLQLRSEGFLESTYRGFILKVYSPESIFDIFSVRLLLEPEAAALSPDFCRGPMESESFGLGATALAPSALCLYEHEP